MSKKNKMKTNRSAAKRFSFTANGKIKRRKAGLRHFMRRRSVRAKRNLGTTGYLSKSDYSLIKTLLPYS